MQSNTLNDRELVQRSLGELCRHAGFADPKNLVQRDLEFLCDSIETKTGVLISLSTIKRLLNGQFSRLPQIATLNAIAKSLGYQNWQDYRSAQNQQAVAAVSAEAGTPQAIAPVLPPPTRHSLPRSKYWIAGGLLILVALGLLMGLKFGKPQARHFEKAEFSINKTTSKDIPNTVVFHYNIDDVNADSFFIQQSWDINRRVRIYKHSHVLTDIYYEPGYHTAKLIAGDQIIKTIDVSIPTDRWFFYAKENKPGSFPKYIPCEGFKNGSLQMDKDSVLASQLDIQKENLYCMSYFPTAIERSSDNFVLTCRVKVETLRNEVCPFIMSEVYCQRNFMYMINTTKGCTSEIQAQFGDNHLIGKTTDFSALGIDVKEWQNLELRVKDRQVSIRINDKEVFTSQYHESSGLITGLGFISNGLCLVDKVELKTLDGKIVYSNDFEK